MSENGDGLDRLRISYEKIKFGKKLEVQGYGSVFEGELEGRRVALKQLNITNLGNVKPKLLAEILTISRFRRHPNLVALLGFCDEKSNEIILVYEYVSSGNLAEKMRKRLTTIQRLEICLGAARGLDYLHTGVDSTTPGIIHGNIKLSKILLNSDSNSSKFEAKVSSFGLSKILPGQAQKTPESMDTADEVTGKVTKESDVYSFGVLLLEVLCGVSELVDTDDYQERHVTELVPKRLEQNKLRKIVHFDIRKEIKTESLEIYAKIACQCVKNNPEGRPTMAQVVEELEKALRLQGGEVSYVQIPGNRNVDGAPDGTVVEDDPQDDGNGVVVDSNILEKEPEDTKITRVDEDAKMVSSDDKLDVAGEVNGDEVSINGASSESTNGEIKNAAEDITTQERSFHALDDVDGECVPDRTQIEDAQKVSSNDPETTEEEVIHDISSNEQSKITDENKDNKQSTIIAAAAESSNDDTSTTDHSVNQEVGELEHLQIPFEKIKFGKKIDVHGYGSMFEGEFDNRRVALKRLNITNLAHIKPTLLVEILTVARFRQHPNVAALLGFCDEKSNEIILVYEYVSSGNLADKMSKHLTTIQRLEICLGAARGLDYLHTGVDSTPGIVHGDIKLSKILLHSSSTSSKFEAKVSGFGLSKLLPGQAQKTLDPTYNAYKVTGKRTKESDVYSFGVLLLEVLCGVPELVDTDDYQERQVTELVPKRLEQNILRKIVHFDIRDEIRTESLETFAKIACQCVTKNPEERPTMAQVVKELEKALRLQGTEVSDVLIVGSSNGNGLPEGTIDKDDQKGDEETIDDIILNEGLDLAGESNGDEDKSIGTSSEKNAAEVIITQEHSYPDDPESTEEIIADLKSNEESKMIGENEVDNENITPSECKGDGSNLAMHGQSFPFPVIGSKEDGAAEGTNIVDAKREKGRADDAECNEETMDDNKNTSMEISKEVQSSGILDSDSTNAGKQNTNSAFSDLHDTEEKPESVINIRERDFSDLAIIEKTQESESKRSDGTCSESSNGDGTTPSDYLLQKSPADGSTTKKPSTNGSRNCCSCAWWRFFSDRVALYGGRFWNKLVWCFTWIKGKFSSKHD